ncbi:uncharacterized protein LOC113375317 [Ctenocephalides felis]|uniref:uncharacterized protein LOC113375317 n=1 Tax=Ctenocephalides felis TaxID=7515 RepID=UPI000E6E23F2|nr:uncharacterized protein LOC113375317 [Ctenocephalides felis]
MFFKFLLLISFCVANGIDNSCTIPFPNLFVDYKYCCKWPSWFDEHNVRSCANNFETSEEIHKDIQVSQCLAECVFSTNGILHNYTIEQKGVLEWANAEMDNLDVQDPHIRHLHQVASWLCVKSASKIDRFINYYECRATVNAYLQCYETMLLYYCPSQLKNIEENVCRAYWNSMLGCYIHRPDFAIDAKFKY